MKPLHWVACAGALLTMTSSAQPPGPASPLYGVTIPDGYRQWQLVAPALEAAPLQEIRTVLGNRIAIDSYIRNDAVFPDGTVLVKLAWRQLQSPLFAAATIPGAATTVQVMVKDSKRYASTGGWGFGRFTAGEPADEAQHRTCFACHDALARSQDYVFTRYAR